MRCSWCGDDPLYIKYHDEEWGVPVYDDRIHFEFLVLESAQAGLSWHTVLKKRENYRKAYRGFDPEVVAKFDQKTIEELMQNKGIIRNRKKIEASVNNAKVFLEIQKEFGSFSNYIWSFVGGKQIVSSYESIEELPAKTSLSEELAKDMKKRGFKFLGPVILYSHMQATGLVNDHIVSCFRYKEVSEFK
ncbi:DNA-3-methyladenine glycosylase I [uncultured Ilyobacter sp.]|jgi:DNA-3-methyladenine glycosylase I|uniref:DNA-3-methyladenine glycosylase I n=1 Tax=uncultured Ilyobacter sp. TaxID=544433 RepID=UPI0029C09935|nr:DNA-3-methyladenine glycosylase I [uncultured Ilyobacter sp.]